MRNRSLQALYMVLLIAFVCSARAESFEGKVVRITDGDSITVLVDKQQVKVRLLEIDAPESKQPFGRRSKESLAEMCAGKIARVDWTSRDRYGRTLGRVQCAGLDANSEQVRRGMAWVFDRYVTDRSLYALQEEAKSTRLGLWADTSPIPPWEWRRQRKLGEVPTAKPAASPKM